MKLKIETKHVKINGESLDDMFMKQPKTFQFKQFTVDQSHCGMPVSTDGVLLGAWAELQGRILDIGTGTGLLSLMSAQRYPQNKITAIEIDKDAYQTAYFNIMQSQWSDRIDIKHMDISDLSPLQKFDSIICNPPYFNSGESAQHKARATARHTQTLSHHQLLKICANLLDTHGLANFILPKTEGEYFIQIASELGFWLKRVCYIHTTDKKPCQRLLICLHAPNHVNHSQQAQNINLPQKNMTQTLMKPTTEKLVIQINQSYTHDFIALTHPFYLKM